MTNNIWHNEKEIMAQGRVESYIFIYFGMLVTSIIVIVVSYSKIVNILLTITSLPTIIKTRGGDNSMSAKQHKHQILRKIKALNLHPERVMAPLFKTHPFFDPKDKVQVKYEMLRSREVEKNPLTKTCLQYGFSRESYRQILKRFHLEGIAGLFEHKRGRKGPVKATEEVQEFIRAEHAHDRSVSVEELSKRCYQKLGVAISRRTVFRILEKKEEDKKKR